MLFFFNLEPYRNRPSSGSNMTYSQYIRPVSAATPCTNSNIHSHNFNNNDSNNIDSNNKNVIDVSDVGDVDICIGSNSSNHNSSSNGNKPT